MIISKKQTGMSSLFSHRLFTYSAAIFLLISCDNTANSVHQGKHASKSAHRVEVVTTELKEVSLTQSASGTLEATTKIRLYNEESGRLLKLPYHEGDIVKKGTLLIQLDNEIIKTDVAKSKAAKQQNVVDLARLKKLLAKKIATEEEMAHAKTDLDLAIADEKRQLTRLKRTTIKAPIDGVISQRHFEPGDMLAQQSHIQTIIDPNNLRLKIKLAERWIPLVKKDQTVKLRISALGDNEFTGKVNRIHPTIDSNTHKGIIEIKLDPVPSGAKVGQFVNAEIELKSTERLVIPVHTIHFEPQGAYVYRVLQNETDKSKVEKIFITQGQQFGSFTEVLSPLKAGDNIVSRGHLGLRNGKEVEIAKADSANENSGSQVK